MVEIVQSNPWLTAAVLFILAVAYKMLANQSRLIRIQRHFGQYEEYFAGQRDVGSIQQSKSDIVQLFKGAGVKDSFVPSVTPVGFGVVSTGLASVWDNMVINREDILRAMILHFNQAIGYYKHRRNEALSPLYWIDEIINLPRAVLGYLGVPAESIFTKIAQLSYWLATCGYAVVSLYDRFGGK